MPPRRGLMSLRVLPYVNAIPMSLPAVAQVTKRLCTGCRCSFRATAAPLVVDLLTSPRSWLLSGHSWYAQLNFYLSHLPTSRIKALRESNRCFVRRYHGSLQGRLVRKEDQPRFVRAPPKTPPKLAGPSRQLTPHVFRSPQVSVPTGMTRGSPMCCLRYARRRRR